MTVQGSGSTTAAPAGAPSGPSSPPRTAAPAPPGRSTDHGSSRSGSVPCSQRCSGAGPRTPAQQDEMVESEAAGAGGGEDEAQQPDGDHGLGAVVVHGVQ